MEHLPARTLEADHVLMTAPDVFDECRSVWHAVSFTRLARNQHRRTGPNEVRVEQSGPFVDLFDGTRLGLNLFLEQRRNFRSFRPNFVLNHQGHADGLEQREHFLQNREEQVHSFSP